MDAAIPNGDIVRQRNWLLSIIGTVCSSLIVAAFSGGVTWLTHLNSELRSHGERIAVQDAQLAAMQKTLDTISRKLDRLLEGHTHKPE